MRLHIEPKSVKRIKQHGQEFADKVPQERPYISIAEAVAMFGISRDAIYRLIRNGNLPAVNLGERLTRISRAHIESMFPLVEQKQQTTRTLNLRNHTILMLPIHTLLARCQRNTAFPIPPFTKPTVRLAFPLVKRGNMYLCLKQKSTKCSTQALLLRQSTAPSQPIWDKSRTARTTETSKTFHCFRHTYSTMELIIYRQQTARTQIYSYHAGICPNQ